MADKLEVVHGLGATVDQQLFGRKGLHIEATFFGLADDRCAVGWCLDDSGDAFRRQCLSFAVFYLNLT